MRRITVFLGLIGALLCGVPRSPAAADEKPESPESLEALLEPIRTKYDIPGLTAAIITGENLVALGSVGVRKRGAKAKVTDEDLWHIGSCTKSMTATLIGRLVEKKKLRWEMTLAEAFPDLAPSMHKGWKTATLDLLLRHRGGAPSDLSRDGLWARLWQHKGSPREARRLLTKTVLAWPPTHKPGTDYLYSNAGFAIVGHAAESLLDTSYEELLLAEILTPLEALPAGFGAPGSAKKLDQPWGHRFRPTERPPVPPGPQGDNPPGITPAGRVHLSMRAWARYIRLHLAGAQDGTTKLLLERATLRHLQTPRKGESYALGWGTGTRPWAGGPVITHNGSNTMWFCVTWLAPKRDVAVLVACNQGGAPGQKATDAAASACIRWFVERAARDAAEKK